MKNPTAAYLCPPGYRGPRGLAILNEARMMCEAARLTRHRLRTVNVPAMPVIDDDPAVDPILLIPGFLAGDHTLTPMSRHLRRLGYRTYFSNIRSNFGCLAETAHRLEKRIEQVATARERRVVLVGHSLGGLLSRSLAARRPDLVSGIVTMGSPLLAPGAVHTLLIVDVRLLLMLQRLGLARVMGDDCTDGECARVMWDEAQQPLAEDLSFASIYSKRDGIMDWRACLDPRASHLEVTSSHCGMAFDPVTFEAVTDALSDFSGRSRQRSTTAVS